MKFETDIDRANRRIWELEAEILRIKSELQDVYENKVLWLQLELDRERNRQWARG